MYGFLKEMNIANTQHVSWSIHRNSKNTVEWLKEVMVDPHASDITFKKKNVWEVVWNSKVFALDDIILSSLLPRKRSEMRSRCLPVA